MDKLAIYIHFPFCLSKCHYCAFYSEKFDQDLCGSVIEKTLSDIAYFSSLTGKREVVSVFFGGGTPSLMRASDISKILNCITKFHSLADAVEITLETNPETVNIEKLKGFARSGVNRISLGVQSFLDNELAFLGRRCSGASTLKAAEAVCRVSSNYSFDLIYGFNIQNQSTFSNSLKQAMHFCPTHVSCYRLTYEKGTPLYNKMMNGEVHDISEADEAGLLDAASCVLRENGFSRYEISNFAKPGYECVHNMMYWDYNDYYGIGASAHGRININGAKYAIENANTVSKWLDSKCNIYELSIEDSTNEAIIMGLRTVNGVDMRQLTLSESQSKKINDFLKMQLIALENSRLKIKSQHLDVCDYITREIITS